MKPLIQFRIKDNKAEFYLLRDVPDEPDDWPLTFKECEQKALRIDNPDLIFDAWVVRIDSLHVSTTDGRYLIVKHNDTFEVPEGFRFEDKTVCPCELSRMDGIPVMCFACIGDNIVVVHLINANQNEKIKNT